MFYQPLHTLARTLALLTTLLSPLAAAAPSPSAPHGPTEEHEALMARAAVPWTARHRQTSAQYQSTTDTLVAAGYRTAWVSGYTISNTPYFAAIWDKNVSYAWAARHGLTSAGYQTTFNQLQQAGYRPRLVNGYTVSNSARFVAIWDKSPAPGNGAWIARHGLTPEQYQSQMNTFVAQGYTPVHVSGYVDAGALRYAALWEHPSNGPAWVARHGLTSAQYQTTFTDLANQGYRPVMINGYVYNNVDYYAGIWDKKPSPPWVARHRMTSAQYQAEFDKWVGQGFTLKVVSAYTLNGNQDLYAAIWVKE